MNHRVVADTNVLISAVIASGPPRRFLDRCIQGTVTLVLSRELIHEFIDVLHRPKLKLKQQEVEENAHAITGTAHLVSLSSQIHVIQDDPDDNLILATAIDGNADHNVTGDRHLLKLKEYQGIPILRVHEFLELVDQ